MKSITFITWNQKKADYLAKYLWIEVLHEKIDLDEIQSLELEEIVEHKVKQAYEKIKKPVIVEDASLEFTALGRLPGPFIKFFFEEMWLEKICTLLWDMDRGAISRTIYGYYDGEQLELFKGEHPGLIAKSPRGDNGYGWDRIFEPTGYNWLTRAELSEDDHRKNYLQIKPLEKVREFLMGK